MKSNSIMILIAIIMQKYRFRIENKKERARKVSTKEEIHPMKTLRPKDTILNHFERRKYYGYRHIANFGINAKKLRD